MTDTRHSAIAKAQHTNSMGRENVGGGGTLHEQNPESDIFGDANARVGLAELRNPMVEAVHTARAHSSPGRTTHGGGGALHNVQLVERPAVPQSYPKGINSKLVSTEKHIPVHDPKGTNDLTSFYKGIQT